MRTTLSLDPDVAAALQRLERERRVTWKQVVNDTLRAGLASQHSQGRDKRPARTKSVRLGRPLVGDIANVHEVLSVVEGDDRL